MLLQLISVHHHISVLIMQSQPAEAVNNFRLEPGSQAEQVACRPDIEVSGCRIAHILVGDNLAVAVAAAVVVVEIEIGSLLEVVFEARSPVLVASPLR